VLDDLFVADNLRTLQDAARDPFDWIEHHRSPRHWSEPLITVMAVVFALAIAAPAVGLAFRFVFNQYFGQSLPLLKSRSFDLTYFGEEQIFWDDL
jgi:hypothetical protein